MGWKTWMETTDDYVVDSKLSFAELVVPTTDSAQHVLAGSVVDEE